MQKAIFDDLDWQHEAFALGGIGLMQQLRQNGVMESSNLQAWEDIATGTPQGIQDGNTALLHREQFDVIQRHYDEMRGHHGPVGDMATYAFSTMAENRWAWIDGLRQAQSSARSERSVASEVAATIHDLLPRFRAIENRIRMLDAPPGENGFAAGYLAHTEQINDLFAASGKAAAENDIQSFECWERARRRWPRSGRSSSSDTAGSSNAAGRRRPEPVDRPGHPGEIGVAPPPYDEGTR